MPVQPLRVAMVSMHTSPADQPGTGDSGGMNVAILNTALQLQRRGVTVDLLTRAHGEPGTRLLAPGVTLHELAAGPIGPLPKEQLSTVVDEFGEAVATLTDRTQPRYDILHAHYWLSGLATLPVALELGLPFVQSFHTLAALKNATSAPDHGHEPERRVRIEMYLANQANAIVAGSAAEATALIDLVRAPPDRVWVVPPGVDVDLFHPLQKDASVDIHGWLDVDPRRPIIAVVGRVQPLKDQELAIRAFAALPEPRPLLVIAGEPTPGDEHYLSALRRLGEELAVADSIRFVGAVPRERLATLLAAAALLLVPSHSETFGIVALESAASGTPTVAFRGTGLEESVADGVSGVLIDSRDPEEWAIVIRGLLADGLALADLGRSARHHAEPYTWAATATALLALYESLR